VHTALLGCQYDSGFDRIYHPPSYSVVLYHLEPCIAHVIAILGVVLGWAYNNNRDPLMVIGFLLFHQHNNRLFFFRHTEGYLIISHLRYIYSGAPLLSSWCSFFGSNLSEGLVVLSMPVIHLVSRPPLLTKIRLKVQSCAPFSQSSLVTIYSINVHV